MKSIGFIFLFTVSIKSGGLFAQVQFTPAARPGGAGHETAVITDADEGLTGGQARESPPNGGRLALTYMGQPVGNDGAAGVEPKSEQAGRADPFLERSTRLLDSLSAVVLRDSLVLIDAQIQSLKRATHSQGADYRRESLADYLANVPSILPVRIRSWSEYRVSSGFGLRWHPIRDMIMNHSGIDLPQPLHTPVYATADGVVDKLVYQPQGLGLAVYIRHSSGYTSIYGHLADHLLYLGDMVTRGQPIGRVGMSGLTTGPHLHYSILEGARPVDPLDFCFLLIESLDRTGRGTGRERVAVPAQPRTGLVRLKPIAKKTKPLMRMGTPAPVVIRATRLPAIAPLQPRTIRPMAWPLPDTNRVQAVPFIPGDDNRQRRGR